MSRLYKYFFISLALFCFKSNLVAQQKQQGFEDITQQAGIDFKYTFGDFSYKNILESSGSGITIFDYNNDGFMDVYLMNGKYLEGISDKEGQIFKNAHNELYQNNGNGSFTKVTKKAGLAGNKWSMAASAIDLDNDGFQDLYVLNFGKNVFYHNNGNGTFTNITKSLGLGGPDKLNNYTKWSIGASFWDYNKDGLLDVMVGNFMAFNPAYFSPSAPDMMPSPAEYKGQASMLYQQLSNGKFVDVTKKNKLFYPNTRDMGLNVFDFDNDGDLDIFQANDHQLNFMFKNNNGIYKEVAVQSGLASNNQGRGTGSMHGTIGDINGDGLIDILVSDLTHGALYKNIGNGTFVDIANESGIAAAMAGKGSWGVALFDFDNDGDLDIVAANGTAEALVLQYPLLLENDGTGHFKDVGKSYSTYFSTKRSGRSLAIFDFNNDGKLDIVVSHVDKLRTPALLKNNISNNNHWIGLTLLGKNGPASAIAAKVVAISGNKKQVLVNQWANGYLSNNDPRLHIGLGKTSKINQLDIYWSNGKIAHFKNIKADQYLTIKEGTGIIKN